MSPSGGGKPVETGPARSVAVLTHADVRGTAAALEQLIGAAVEAGVELRFSPDETAKHDLAGRQGIAVNADPSDPRPDICMVLGGDGTILRALRLFAHRGVPVFSINFGRIGFLSTVDQTEAGPGIERALAGDFDVLHLPALAVEVAGQRHDALNDITFARLPGARVADLGYSLGGEEVGRARCDGLVAATPAGSTGYNLANAGPILTWGVEGFVVSFIAPHTLTARSLVVAPQDLLHVRNGSELDEVEVAVDGQAVCRLAPGAQAEVAFRDDVSCLAQLPGANFYHRLREKFGRLVT